ncbi:hypothetical protein Drorol1_Dr00000915 [Drosera rotundifolia]
MSCIFGYLAVISFLFCIIFMIIMILLSVGVQVVNYFISNMDAIYVHQVRGLLHISRDMSWYRYWNCNEIGYMKKDCKNTSSMGNVNFSGLEKEKIQRDMYVVTACPPKSDRYVWYVDMGASYHMTPRKGVIL